MKLFTEDEVKLIALASFNQGAHCNTRDDHEQWLESKISQHPEHTEFQEVEAPEYPHNEEISDKIQPKPDHESHAGC